MILENGVSDLVTATAFGAGGLLGAAVFPPAALITGTAAAAFAAIIANSDLVMSDKSNLPASREVMSHEYGHYMFCNLMNQTNQNAVDYVVWSNVVQGTPDLTYGLSHLNEAMAEFFAGQVTGGADYRWLPNTSAIKHIEGSMYCTSDATTVNCGDLNAPIACATSPCWDTNFNQVETDPCNDLPHHAFTNAEISPNATIRLVAPADPNSTVMIEAAVPIP